MEVSLDPSTARLVRVTAAICLGSWEALREERSKAPAGEPDRCWREAVLQSHLFAGFPRLVEAYGVLASSGGLGELEEGELEGGTAPDARGAELFETIYGQGAGRVRETLASYHGDFARFIARHAYATILARPGLDAARRELCAVAALIATGQDRQLASHARGAVRCGASPDAVLAVPDVLEGLVAASLLERGRTVALRFAREE